MIKLPSLVIWPDAKERPKTRVLKAGLKELGVRVEKSKQLLRRFSPPSNPRGPYIYPMMFVYGQKKKLVFYDINTLPKKIFRQYLLPGALYFKNHLHESIREAGIFPAPNSPSQMDFFEYLPELRKIKDARKYDYDFFFVGWHDDDGTRMRCVKEARRQPWKDFTGLMPFKHHTTVPQDLEVSRLPYLEHLRLQCKSKLCLALPGGRALPYCSFRHAELWGMGCAVISVKPDCVLPGNPGSAIIPFKKDMSDFVRTVEYYLRHDEERERIAAKGREYFERFLTPKANALYVLKIISKRI